MFALSDEDLRKHILGCGDGPASFNSVLTRQGGHVVSVDPVYRFSAHEIRRRIDETYDTIVGQTRKNMDEFVWRHIASIEELGQVRMAAMEEFLGDYEEGVEQGRYVDAALPDLPFENEAFDLALCSHFLFLYSEQLSAVFHVRSIKELCRVAAELRVFPLLELGSKMSRHLDCVRAALTAEGYGIKAERVPYEFQRGGNEMWTVAARR
jgi:hypothetical protein